MILSPVPRTCFTFLISNHLYPLGWISTLSLLRPLSIAHSGVILKEWKHLSCHASMLPWSCSFGVSGSSCFLEVTSRYLLIFLYLYIGCKIVVKTFFSISYSNSLSVFWDGALFKVHSPFQDSATAFYLRGVSLERFLAISDEDLLSDLLTYKLDAMHYTNEWHHLLYLH